MNKYQEALDHIKNVHQRPSKTLKECFDTLQELIDNYSKLEKALDKTCEQLEEFTLQLYDEGISFKPCIMKKEIWKKYYFK